MRIVGSESPSLPPLDPPLPSENSWALQVESEEAARFHSKDYLYRDHIGVCGKETSWSSSKWADCGCRDASHESRDAQIKSKSKTGRSFDQDSHNTLGTSRPYAIESCDYSWRQGRSIRQNTRRQIYSPAQGNYRAIGNGNSRSVGLLEAGRKNEKKISPTRSHRSHHHQSRAALNEASMYTDTKVSEMADMSHHVSSRSSDNAHSRQSHRARHGGTRAARFSDNTDYARHQRIQDVQLSENKDDARHGCHRRTQDVKLARSADNARYKKPSQSAADNESYDCPEWHNRSLGHKAFRRSKENVYCEVQSKSNRGIDELKPKSRPYSDYCKQSQDEGCIQAGFRAEGSGVHGIDARNGICEASIPPSEIKTRFASEISKELGMLLMQHGLNEGTGDEESDTTSSQAEGISNTSTDGQSVNVQKNSSGSNIMLEMSSQDDAKAKEDDPLDKYKILASLLLDDSLDIGQEFDVALAPGGQDLEYCGSIFDADFELPVSIDVEAAAHVKDAVPAKKDEAVNTSQPMDLQVPHLCVMRGLFQDGKNIMKNQSISSSKLVEEHAASTNTGFQPVEKQQYSQDSSKQKLSPRVFVDVTNNFEIHTAPVKGETQENDSHRLNQRQRQVEFGKNTLGYERYSELVPRCKRKPKDPQTPNPKQICSKRSWDGQIRKWRRLLHAYDLPSEEGEERAEDFSILKSRHGHAANSMQDTTRFSKSIENEGCNASEVKIKEDANLTIYDDWMVS